MDKPEQDYREKFTLEQVEQALRAAYGNQSKAARMLNTNRSTINGYLNRYEYLRDVVAEAKEHALDIAEDQLMEKIKDGNMAAIIFFLKTQGKGRGYVEKQDKKDDETEKNRAQGPSLNDLSTEQLQELASTLKAPKVASK